MNQIVANGAGVLALAREFGDALLAMQSPEAGDLSWIIPHRARPGALSWNNPENLDTGTSGLIVFLLELYKQSGEKAYLEGADEALRKLIRYCETHPTDNYALYTGRGGVAYALLERYLIDGEAAWLEKAADLVYPSNEAYLHSDYTTDGLYEGLAGTLLLLNALARFSGRAFLAGHVDQFVTRLAAKAVLSPGGVAWQPEDDFDLHPACDFAHGTAGVRYALRRLAGPAQHPALDLMINAVDQHTLSRWDEGAGNWPNYRLRITEPETFRYFRKRHAEGVSPLFAPGNDFSWSGGAAGILASALADQVPGFDALTDKALPGLAPEAVASKCLYDGLAGIGLGLWEIGKKNDTLPVREALDQIIDTLAADPGVAGLEGGLLHGYAGVMYFLLKTGNAQPGGGNVLLPALPATAPAGRPEVPLTLTPAAVRKGLLARHYPRTLMVLEMHAAAHVADFLAGPHELKLLLTGFQQFVQATALKNATPTLRDRLLDVFILEKNKLDFLKGEKASKLEVHLRDLAVQEHLVGLLNHPDEWLLTQTLRVSRKIRLVVTKWNWDFTEDFKELDAARKEEQIHQNFKVPAGRCLSMMQVFGKRQVGEVALTMPFKMLLEAFEQPKPAGRALLEIKECLRFLPTDFVQGLLPEYSNVDPSDDPALFFERLDWAIVNHMRPLIYKNILLFENP